MRTTAGTLAVRALAAMLVLGGCGFTNGGSRPETSTKVAPTAADPRADLVGTGCADYAKAVPDGVGSFREMARERVVAAAASNPLLTKLTAALSGKLNPEVDLGDTLDRAPFTLFAPVDTAFAKLDDKTVRMLASHDGAERLDAVLTYHLIPGRIAPADIAGIYKTVNGADILISGGGDSIKVGGGQANVICGGITTANATVYLVDTVVMPPG